MNLYCLNYSSTFKLGHTFVNEELFLVPMSDYFYFTAEIAEHAE